MELRIVPLSFKEHYFDDMIDILYDEWHDIYATYGMKDKTQVTQFYENLKGKIYIALVGDKVVGCYSIASNLISDVCVSKQFRRKHIGRELIRDALRRLWYYYVVKLYCTDKMVKYYKDCGFTVADGSNPKAVLMTRQNHALVLMVVVLLVAFVLIWTDGSH